MADSVSLGGITIKFGADVSNLKRASKEAVAEVKGFSDALGRIALKGAVKGDPFSATKDYMKQIRAALDSTFSEWANSLEDFDHKMGATATAARKEITKLIEKFHSIPDQAKKAIALTNAAMDKLDSDKLGLVVAPHQRRIPEKQRKEGESEYRQMPARFRLDSAKDAKFQEQFLAEYSQFGKRAATMAQSIIDNINNGTIKSREVLDVNLRGLAEILSKHRERLEKKMEQAASPEMFEELQKAYMKLGKLEQQYALQEARSPKATKDDRLAQADKLYIKEARLLTQKRQGMDVDREILKIYEQINRLNVPLSKKQEVSKQTSEEDIQKKTIEDAGSEEAYAKQLKAQKVALYAQEAKLLTQKKNGLQVDQEILKVYQKLSSLKIPLTDKQEATKIVSEEDIRRKSIEDAGSEEAYNRKLQAQKDVLYAQEAQLLTQKKHGLQVDQEILKVYEKLSKIKVPLTGQQESTKLVSEENIRKQQEDLRRKTIRDAGSEETFNRNMQSQKDVLLAKEAQLLTQKRHGLNVDQEILKVYERLSAIKIPLDDAQQKRVVDIQTSTKRDEIKSAGSDETFDKNREAQLHKIAVAEAELLAQKRRGIDVTQELVSLYNKLLALQEPLSRSQQDLLETDKRRIRLAEHAVSLAKRRAKKAEEEAETEKRIRQLKNDSGKEITDEREVQALIKHEREQYLIAEKTRKSKELQQRISEKQKSIAMERKSINQRVLAIEEKRKAIAFDMKNLDGKAPAEVKSIRERVALYKLEKESAELEKRKTAYASSSVAVRQRQTEAAESYRSEITKLNAEIRQGFNVQSNQAKMQGHLVSLKETGITLTRKEVAELNKLTAARRKAAIAQEKANKTSKLAGIIDVGRLAWFAKLRFYWAIYQTMTDSIRSLVDAHTQLSRALRTARSEFKSTSQVASLYHEAMKEVVAVHGVQWEQAGEVLYQLGSAGLSAEESLSALNSTMSLIVGTEGDARETTKAIAGIYNNYAEEISGATTKLEKFEYINDLVAKAWSEHQVEISELTDGYKQSIAMTKAAGLELNELTAILAVANDHMIKGGRAGRALQNVFMRLSRSPYEFAEAFDLSNIDFDPSKPIKFIDLMGKLSEKMEGGSLSAYELSRNFERLGLRGGPIFTTLLQNWDKVSEALEDFDDVRGEASRLEEVRLDNLAGAWSRFTGTLKAMVQEVSPLINSLKDGLVSLTKAINNIRGNFLVDDIISGDVEANKSHLDILEDYQKTLMERQKRHLEFRRQLYASVAETYEFRGQKLKAQKGLPLETLLDDLLKRYPKKFKGVLQEIDRAVEEEYKRITEKGGGFKGKYVVDVVSTDHLPEILKVIEIIEDITQEADAVKKVSIFTDWEAPEKAKDAYWDALSDDISDAQKAVTRFLVTNNMGEFDNVLRETFSEFKNDVNTFNWGKVDQGLGESVTAIRDVKREFKDIKSYSDETKPAFSEDLVQSVDAAKQMLYFRKSIEDIDTQILEKRKLIGKTTALALESKTRGESYEREQRFESIKVNLIKQVEELQAERKETLSVIVALTEKEKDAMEDQLRSYKAKQTLNIKELDTKLRNYKYLGLTSTEEYLSLNIAKEKLSVSLERNRAEYAIGRITKEGADGALRELKAKKEAADAASEEVYQADILNIHKTRTNSIMKEAAAKVTILETKFKKIETIQKLNTQTQEEALKFIVARSSELKRSYKLQLYELEVQLAKVEGTDQEADVKAKIATIQQKITNESIKQVVANDSLVRQGSIIYDMFTRLRDITKDLTTWWHDLVYDFIIGFAEGMTDIFYDFISGSQEAQQEVINLEGSLEDLENQAAAIEEKGVFSYEEAQNLIKLREEIAAVKDEIDELQDPLKQAENAFKDFFKELIDEIGKMIIKMLVLKAIQAALGWGTSGEAYIPSEIGGGPGSGEFTYKRAEGGITPSIDRIESLKQFGTGGITGNPMVALLGDNPSGKELIIPAENISKDKVTGYSRESGGNEQPINVVNVLTKQDIAAALTGKEGERVIVNHIGRDLNNNGPIARRLRI